MRRTMSEIEFPHYVFVYGTLKTGEPNHHWMTEEFASTGRHKFVGKAQMKTR